MACPVPTVGVRLTPATDAHESAVCQGFKRNVLEHRLLVGNHSLLIDGEPHRFDHTVGIQGLSQIVHTPTEGIVVLDRLRIPPAINPPLAFDPQDHAFL